MTTLQKQAERAPLGRTRSGATVLPFRPHVVGAVFGRNLLSYFSNPAGYVFITLFVLVCSWFEFWQPVFFTNNLVNLDPLNNWMPYILLFFVPAITMSIWAEERRQGTDELLLTLPARDVEVVLGKYLAALGIYTVSLGFLALGHVPVLMVLGRPDFGVLFATYLGYWFMGGLLIAVGMVASVLTSSVTVGFILGALFCAIPVLGGGLGPIGRMLGYVVRIPGLGWLAPGEPGSAGMGLARGLESLSVPVQFRDFGTGVIPLVGVCYFVALTIAMLYVNMILLGRRHWAGGRESGGRWAHALARVAAVVVALVCLDVLVGRWLNVRLDATEERLHSLSATSRQVIREIPSDRPVYIQAYYSQDVPREYVEAKSNLLNTLKEYAALGGDRIRLNLVETRLFSPEAREAERRYGITPKSVFTTREGRQESTDMFLGVSLTSGLEQVVVPFFDRGLPVEYELTRSIRVVSGSQRKRVGILDTDAKLLGRLDMRSFAQDPEWAIVSELRKQYDVTSVSADAPIPFEEVQTISITGQPTSGTFTLTFDGETTKPLAFDSDDKAVANAMAELAKLDPGDVSVEGGPLPKQSIRVTFTGRYVGKDVPEMTAAGELKNADGTRATVQVGTTTTILDALVVAQASSLPQRQMDNLTEFIRKGGPTLLLLDPMPLVNSSIAPAEPRVPDQAMMMGQPSEPKGNIRPLLDSLGVDWPAEQIVWNPHNPHLQFQVPMEYVFISRSGGASNAFAVDPITTRLQEVFLPFPGLLRSREMPGDPQFTPLLRTDRLGGTLAYTELMDRGPFGMTRLRPDRRYRMSDTPYILAARIEGKVRRPPGDPEHPDLAPADNPSREVRVIVLADLDMISNSFFEMRKRPIESLDTLDFDNVTFVLNCVDVLAGDDTFLELRKKRPTFRTLARLEEESKRFIERSQAEEKKAEDNAKTQLDEARKRLQDAVESIRKSNEYDERTKETMVRYREQVEQRRLDVKEAEIEAQKKDAIRESRDQREEAIGALQNRVRSAAILLPPLPAFVLGAIVFFVRARRENLGANPERLT